MNRRRIVFIACSLAAIVLATTVAHAKSERAWVAVQVKPPQAFVFLDGDPIHQGGSFHAWDGPGEHTILVVNYGYKPYTQKFNVEVGKTTKLKIALEPMGGDVSGPWGRIQLVGQRPSAVLLNGKTPEYFVGHVDEFDHDFLWTQELLVPPGTHQLTVVHPFNHKEIFSGPVTVQANQRVFVNLNHNGEQKTTPWPRGERLKSLPRFRAGMANTTVAVAPVTAELSANPGTVKCGESSQLTWSGTEVISSDISGIGKVAPSGQQAVQPRDNTTYKLTASGVGGTVTKEATVSVEKALTASLSVTPQEVRYRRVGDKVEEQGSATLAWSAPNAKSVTIDGIGAVGPSGDRSVRAAPKKTDPGPVDETVTYQLTATNDCGGSVTQSATLHITGGIEPAVQVPNPVQVQLETKLALNSVFFPTALPTQTHPEAGLVKSQQAVLTELAENFQKYMAFQPSAHLILQAHADQRGSVEYNQALSERRAARVKSFLVEHGVPEASIETVGFGKVKNLDTEEVRRLEEENPNLSPALRRQILRNLNKIVLVSNRRADVVLSTTGQQSTRYLPHNAEDFEILLSGGELPTKPTAKPAARRTKKTPKPATKK